MYIRRHTGIYCRSVTLCNCGSWPSSMYRSVIFPFDVGDCGHSRQGREDDCKVPSPREHERTGTLSTSGIPQDALNIGILITSDFSLT